MSKTPLKERLRFSYGKFKDRIFHPSESAINNDSIIRKNSRVVNQGRGIAQELSEKLTQIKDTTMEKIESHTRDIRDLLKKFIGKIDLERTRDKFTSTVKSVNRDTAIKYASIAGLGLGGVALYRQHQKNRQMEQMEGYPSEEEGQSNHRLRRLGLIGAGAGMIGLASRFPKTMSIAGDKAGDLLRKGVNAGVKLPFTLVKHTPKELLGNAAIGLAFPHLAAIGAAGSLAKGAYKFYRRLPKNTEKEKLWETFKSESAAFRNKTGAGVAKKMAPFGSALHKMQGKAEDVLKDIAGTPGGGIFDGISAAIPFAAPFLAFAGKNKLMKAGLSALKPIFGKGSTIGKTVEEGLSKVKGMFGMKGATGPGAKTIGEVFRKPKITESAAKDVGKLAKFGKFAMKIAKSPFNPLSILVNNALNLASPSTSKAMHWKGTLEGFGLHNKVASGAEEALDSLSDVALLPSEITNRALGRSSFRGDKDESLTFKALDFIEDKAKGLLKPAIKPTSPEGPMGTAKRGLGNFMVKKEPFDFASFASIIGKRESSGNQGAVNQYGYLGKYQMGAGALEDVGLLKPGTSKKGNSALDNEANWTIKGGKKTFLGNLKLQEEAFKKYTMQHLKALKDKGIVTAKSTEKEIAGLLAAAHLKGVGGAVALFQGGVDSADAFGTKASEYMKLGKASQISSVPEIQIGPHLNNTSQEVGNQSTMQKVPLILAPQTTNINQGGTKRDVPETQISSVRNDENSYKRAQNIQAGNAQT